MIPYIQIGTGRLGAAIIKAIKSDPNLSSILSESLLSCEKHQARLEPKNGLLLSSISTQSVKIDKLLICIAPGAKKKWRWNDIFVGLAKQVERRQLSINELIFISSTRVYDGISSGIVTAEVPPIAATDRAEGLLVAEKQLAKVANAHCLLRCCGLIGEQYQRFQAILEQSDDKVRFAVDIKQVASKVVERLNANRPVNQCSIVTDGGCYYRGQRLAFEESLFLSSKHRLLQQSDYFKQ